MRIKVFKFGGTSLGNAKMIDNAVSASMAEIRKGSKVISVVSAMGKMTDRLYNIVQEIDKGVTVEDSMEVLGMGEIISGRIFNYLMKQKGIKSKLVEPFAEDWPIVLDDHSQLDKSKTDRKVKKYFPKIFERYDSIVVPGFIALQKNRKWGTLGRGGSDTTAFILGRYIGAEEVIIVTDVDGVYSADPSVYGDAKHINYIDADDLSTMSSFGSQVIHSDALSFKGSEQKARIIHHSFGNLAYEGTVIDGTATRKLFLLEDRLSLITIYKKDITGSKKLVKKLSDLIYGLSKVFGVTLGIDYLGFYIPFDISKDVVRRLGKISQERGFNIAEKRDIALLIMRRESPVNLPGMINYLLTPLAEKKLNIVEVISIGREILIFVRWGDRENAMKILKRHNERSKSSK
jgi:aspartate kinase